MAWPDVGEGKGVWRRGSPSRQRYVGQSMNSLFNVTSRSVDVWSTASIWLQEVQSQITCAGKKIFHMARWEWHTHWPGNETEV